MISKTVQDIRDLCAGYTGKYVRYGKVIGGLALGIVVLILIYFSYGWYAVHQAQVAQRSLAHAFEVYKQNSKNTSDKNWASAEQLFQLSYDEQSRSSLAPYFLVLESDALLEQGKWDEALKKSEEAVAILSPKNILFALFQLRYASMLLNAHDEMLVEKGRAIMEQQANDTSSHVQDAALYLLGQYYFSQGKADNARQLWQTLVTDVRWSSGIASPWVARARQSLESNR